MALRSEWDPAKARRNLHKHGVSFEEAASAFEDEFSLTLPDPTHSVGEERFVLLGRTSRGRVVVVAFTVRRRYCHYQDHLSPPRRPRRAPRL